VDLRDAIRREAGSLGFSACGFAAATPLARGAFLAGWLDAGFAGEMRYLARHPERRLTVAGILPEARTVVSLAFPYAPPAVPLPDLAGELRGRVAAYACGEDYHDAIGRRLGRLIDAIARLVPGSRTRPYVDTGAVLEREWAVRGGLGWFGKNTMLLSTRAGSWFFLAELVTSVAIDPDPPTGAHCGRCTSCLDACPTGALADGLVMDAPRCISYLTIEHRGAIPLPLRPRLGAWIFGCDVCQSACPWNESERPTVDDAEDAPWLASPARSPQAAADWLYPRLPDLLALDETGFRARYGRTAVARTKRRGLLRNAAVVLGNSGNPEAVAPLVRALRDPEPLVRGHAAWALGALGGATARAALDAALAAEPDADVQGEITRALATAS
jgi:epoxyqueuosine reductase